MPKPPVPTCLPWTFSLFQDAAQKGMSSVHPFSNVVKREAVLRALLFQPPQKSAAARKKDLHCWSPALYEEGKRRCNKNVQSISTLVLDYDDTEWTPSRKDKHLTTLGMAHAIHTSWSHTPESPRYRVILFLSRALTRSEFLAVRAHVIEQIGYTEGLDDLKDLSRHYALPVQRTGAQYKGYLDCASPTLCVDEIMEELPTPAPGGRADQYRSAGAKSEDGLDLSLDTVITLFPSNEKVAIADLIEEGTDKKHKCQCPFQADSTSGSAFLRVLKDGRVFVICKSERHDHAKLHDKTKVWLNNKAKAQKPRPNATAAERKELLSEIPDKLVMYVENQLAYCTPQTVYYWRQDGCWSLNGPWKQEGLFAHLDGLLTGNLGPHHIHAMISHIRSRQVLGFTCDSARAAIVQTERGRMLNTYAQPEIQPSRGTWKSIQKLMHVLCDGDARAVEWLMHWSAALIQRPERRSMVAVLCLSPEQGIGKSMYGKILEEIIGPKNGFTVKDNTLRDNFNSSFVTSLLVLADEVGINGRGDGPIISALKTYITDDSVPCRAPHAAAIKVQNRMTWWLTSNHTEPVVLEKTARRFTVLRPSPTNQPYRQMLADCFDSAKGSYTEPFRDEMAAFAYALHSITVDYDFITKPLPTKARQKLQRLSTPPHEDFWEELEKKGTAFMLTQYPPPPEVKQAEILTAGKGTVPCLNLYGSFYTWTIRKKQHTKTSEKQFRAFLEDLSNITIEVRRIAGSPIDCYVGLPTQDLMEETDNVIHLTPDNY